MPLPKHVEEPLAGLPPVPRAYALAKAAWEAVQDERRNDPEYIAAQAQWTELVKDGHRRHPGKSCQEWDADLQERFNRCCEQQQAIDRRWRFDELHTAYVAAVNVIQRKPEWLPRLAPLMTDEGLCFEHKEKLAQIFFRMPPA